MSVSLQGHGFCCVGFWHPGCAVLKVGYTLLTKVGGCLSTGLPDAGCKFPHDGEEPGLLICWQGLPKGV